MEKYKRLLFIINPNAGIKKDNGLIDILNIFYYYDYEPIVLFTRKRNDATDYVVQHAFDDISLIVCMGGDGTLNEVFAGAVQINWKKPIGYIPAGSTNDFASSLGLPGDHLENAKRIMTGTARYLDLAEFNKRSFVYTASCGLFSRTSYETPQKVKNLLGHFAYILEGVKDISQFKPVYMEIECEDKIIKDEFILVSLCNTFSLGGVVSFEDKDIKLDDGYFELLTISKPRDIVQLNSIVYSLYEQNYDNSYINFFKVKFAKITMPIVQDWSLDGEKEEGKTICEFNVMHKAVQLIY